MNGIRNFDPRVPMTRAQQYEYLIHELNAIAVETSYQMREAYARGKFMIGQTIHDSTLYDKKGRRPLIERIAADMEVNEREIYYCIQFYEKALELAGGDFDGYAMTLPFGKEISWTKIKKHLPTYSMSEEDRMKRAAKERLKLRAPRIKRSIKYSQEKIGKVWTQEDHDFLYEHLKVQKMT